MTKVYYLTLWFLHFVFTPGKSLRGKYWDADRQMKPLFFKCHDSKTRCKEGGATTCKHSLQSLKRGLKLRASRVRSVICCKHGMKEAESKITRFLCLLKRKSSVLKCLYLCYGSGHSMPPRQQYLCHCPCAPEGRLLQHPHYLYLPIIKLSVVHNRCFTAGIRGNNELHGPGCLFLVWDSWEECTAAPSTN